MRINILIFLLSISVQLFGQYDSDAQRLSKMEYMKYAAAVDCNDPDNSSLEHRICINLKFQEVDSVLNVRFKELCEVIEEPTVREQLISYHESWIDYRRLQSKLVSEGYQGHSLGIVYLGSMVEMTERRTADIDALLKQF